MTLSFITSRRNKFIDKQEKRISSSLRNLVESRLVKNICKIYTNCNMFVYCYINKAKSLTTTLDQCNKLLHIYQCLDD